MPDPPGTFCPAMATTTPMFRPLDLSEGAMASATSILGSPPLSHPATSSATPLDEPPGTFLGSPERFDTHSTCAPFPSHPANRHPTPMYSAPGLSRPSIEDTTSAGVPVDAGGPSNADTHRRLAPLFFLTRPCEVRHPSPTRRVLSRGPIAGRHPLITRPLFPHPATL
jgi:hypothetical protein